ncbi:hypothetical protein A3G55_01035 [Candidatus Giovannonibacteria bacterium RIFCSPLOWO2_12_FULL_44_25]|uniref:Uncharacterized protein n=1 Tax=Candidatus Giovannonibacteria bacterium RIFCSPHIGHO2_02_FULL_45_40 TaxID=1798337 RepID=A0A1F5WAQ5_9BACT|nr:MAG: hypothetical protein A2120_02750 [Candidatus Giovannonibacteria bacterium GWA2_45_15]OGF60642.1 MAG: hypothetical protein A2656_02755 [Candidatus Giovannonibacteria bacterium RIFCSPHIGHO2_01_FULL_44_100]OGF72728.1 MAG: hypothetical protein A3C05_03555 [Candidatus Giovannonibacteria bacterium RIFCSPHIGHO2_02_FULL_45_40]OGF83857.1 MAG: hypothetical protein A3E63_01455 [Candidatus Giovannonibacteria bacterium RIFCSPHIGHO2_12_FULL_45_19]OGF84856.1 MAG: hypothetical protein A3A19_02455 [Cand
MPKDPLSLIEKLQKKSEAERMTIAALIVVFLMAAIIGVWITTFSITPSEPIASASEPSPFSLLWNFIKESAGQIYK